MLKLKNLKRSIFILTAIIFIGFIPLEFAHGDLIEDIGAGLSGAIVVASSNIIGVIAGVIQTLGANMLDFALSDQFVSQSGADSNLVQNGWGIVRNFANATLVIGLVIIAINIILGKEEGKAKQSLIVFVIAAVLINFTPLICGFIIDGVNLLGRSFLGGGIGGDMIQNIIEYKEQAEGLKGEPIQALANIIFVFIFSIASFMIYLLYALLFIVRAVVLWILIIVSPIAVATKVFPKSNIIRKFFPNVLYWDDWIEAFLQWCLIIVPASLFIYLGNFAMRSVVSEPFVSSGDILTTIISGLFSYIIPLVILYVGFLMTIIAGGSIAAPIGNLGKKGFNIMKGTAKKAGTWTKEGALGTAGAMIQGKNPLRFDNRDSGRMSIENAKDKVGGWARKPKEFLHFGKDQDYKSRSAAAEETLIKTPEEYFKGEDAATVQNEAMIATQRAKSAGLNGDKIKEQKIIKSLGSAVLNNKYLSEEDKEKILKDNGTNTKEFVSKISPDDASKNLSSTALKNKNVIESLTAEQVKSIYSKGTAERRSTLVDSLEKIDLKDKSKDIIENIRNSKLAIMTEKDKVEDILYKRRSEAVHEIIDLEKELKEMSDKSSEKAKMIEKAIESAQKRYESLDEEKK